MSESPGPCICYGEEGYSRDCPRCVPSAVHEMLEEFWGTAWGEAEAEAYRRIIALVRDPESTQRGRSVPMKHVVMVKHRATGYVTAHWIYDDPSWAAWKAAELAFHDRRKREFVRQVVSI